VIGRGIALGILVLAVTQPTSPEDIARGRLAACPNSPNCVSSQAEPEDKVHFIEALPADGDSNATLARLQQIIASTARTRIVSSGDGYLHAEYTSRIFRWVDDVELLADPAADAIQVRSASRTGYGDLGANRSRVEELREALAGASG
jgi:uncharacterized protein (DUF1499 family)